MPRVLHVDASRGISAGSLAGAFIDAGVAPSPVMHAVAGLGFGGEMRFDSEPGGVRGLVAADAGPMRPPTSVPAADVAAAVTGSDWPREAIRITEDAVMRMASDSGTIPLNPSRDDALLLAAAAAVALASLPVDTVAVGGIQVGTSADDAQVAELLGNVADTLVFDGEGRRVGPWGAAFLVAAIAPENFGLAEPQWTGHASRGTGLGDGRTTRITFGLVP